MDFLMGNIELHNTTMHLLPSGEYIEESCVVISGGGVST